MRVGSKGVDKELFNVREDRKQDPISRGRSKRRKKSQQNHREEKAIEFEDTNGV